MWPAIKKMTLFENVVMMIVITFVLYSACRSHKRDPNDKYISRYDALCTTPLYISLTMGVLIALYAQYKK